MKKRHKCILCDDNATVLFCLVDLGLSLVAFMAITVPLAPAQ